MTVLWTDKTAAQATGGKAQGQWQADRVEIDSRRVRAGDLFVALRGENFDGHDYVVDAFAKGAVAAVVSSPSPCRGEGGERSETGGGKSNARNAGLAPTPALPPAGGGGLLTVPDTQTALEALARFARARSAARIIGITGSVGKTSAKEMLRLALSAHGEAFANAGNFNNHIGTPLTLANLPRAAEFAVFEMGMNHAGEISQLTRMVRPHVAAITTVEAAHTEFFPSVEAIAHAKSEIFERLEDGGVAVLNRDNPHFAVMEAGAKGARIVTFGAHERADCRLIDYRATSQGCEIEAAIHGKTMRYRLKAVGRHWAITSLMTLAITHALGLDDATTAQALADFGELEGRGQMLPIEGGVTLIDDSYNASPAAMRAAFAKAAEVRAAGGAKGRLLAALGDMRELGSDAPRIHAGLAGDLARAGFDGVFTAGELMAHLRDALPNGLRMAHAASAGELLPVLRAALRPGDILLVKGSHGSHMYELAAGLRGGAGEKKHAV